MENISTQSKNRQSEGPCLRFACLSAVAYNLGSARWTRRSRFPRTPVPARPARRTACPFAGFPMGQRHVFFRNAVLADAARLDAFGPPCAARLLRRLPQKRFGGLPSEAWNAAGTGGVHPAAPLQPGWAIKSPAFSSFPIINGMTSSRRICSTLENSPYSISSASFMIFSSAAWNFFPSLSFSSRLK